MHFESTPAPHELSNEQRSWINRYIGLIPALEAMDEDSRASFDQLVDHVLEDRFGNFPVVADVLQKCEPTIEVLPFMVPILEDLLAHLADGTLVETAEAWVLITDDPESDDDFEISAEILGLTDPTMIERFEIVMMELRGLTPEHRSSIINTVFDIVEEHFMENPGIAAYYEAAVPNNDAAFVIVPLLEAALADNRTFNN